MSDELNSQLSAFVDDELTPEESELFVRRLCRDKTLRRTAAYYGIIGDMLRGESSLTTPTELAARVMMAIDGQGVPVEAPAVHKNKRSIPNWGYAAAASVALAVVALTTLPNSDPGDPAATDVFVAGNVSSTGTPALAENSNPVIATNAPAGGLIDSNPLPDSRSGLTGPAALGVGMADANSPADIFNVPMAIPATAENRARLNNLLLQHLNSSGASPQQGLVGFRNVGFVTQTESQR